MSENRSTNKSGGADWFVQGVLSKIGDIFDKMTGRGWQKASTLSASELVERLKLLLDSEVRNLDEKGKFVPHNIKLKMQWNKFSTESEHGLRKLEYELLAAAIDHINDNLYHTYKPIRIAIKTDYFTDGIKFLASFDEFGNDESEAEINVTIPQLKSTDLIPQPTEPESHVQSYVADFVVDGKSISVELKFSDNRKRVSVGRTKENDLVIEDPSISKVHAALVLNPQNMLLVADTGSTNGTFLNESRIAYGRAFAIGESDKLRFGNVDVFVRRVPKIANFDTQESYADLHSQSEALQYEPQPTIAAEAGKMSSSVSILTGAEKDRSLAYKKETNQESPDATAAQPESDFDELPRKSGLNDVVQPEIGANETRSGDEIPVGPTEPRIKLNFDE